MPPSNVRKCPFCQQETALTHEFCDHCGKGLGEYCIHCGAERAQNGTFCVKCGHEFKPFPKRAPGEEPGVAHRPEAPAEDEPPTPFFPVWLKRLILGAVILFVTIGLGLWLTVWFLQQWSEMGAGERDTLAPASSIQSAAESNAPSSESPIMIPDTIPTFSRDPHWQARFEHWYVAYLPKFKPIASGALLEVETRTGVRMTGTLVSVSNRLVTVNREGMEFGIEASQLTGRTLSLIFREAYAQEQAAKEVEREQLSEGQSQALRTGSGTRSAHRPTLKPGAPSGPAAPAAPATEFQTDLSIFKSSMVRLVISLLVIVGVVVVIRHVW
jgi:hypothetical protein